MTRLKSVMMVALLCVLSVGVSVSRVQASPPNLRAFAAAAVVPVDASVVVRVRDAKGLRADESMLPAQLAVLRLASSRVLVQTWDLLASDLGVDPSGLFNLLLGTDVTYIERTKNGKIEWAIITHIEQPTYDLMIAKLKPAVSAGGRAVFPVQQVASAWRPPNLVLGPADRTGLLDEVVSRIDGQGAEGSIAATPDYAPVASWESAPVEVLWMHALPVGGMSAFSVRSVGSQLRVRHRSRFVRAPIHVASGAPADAGLLRSFEEVGIASLVMNPWRGELDDSEPVDAFLLEGGYNEPMRANMGARQVLVVGETTLDGTKIRVPNLAVAFEVRDPLLAEKQWDGWAQRFAESVARRAASAVPERAATDPGAPKMIDIAPAARVIFAEHPFAQSVQLSWMTVTGNNGSWQLVATDSTLLKRVSAAITTAERAADPDDANELGSMSGKLLALHMRSWLTQTALFAPETPEPFAQAVTLAADIASVADRVHWRARASEQGSGVIESEVVIDLAKRMATVVAPVTPALPAVAPAPTVAPAPPAPTELPAPPVPSSPPASTSPPAPSSPPAPTSPPASTSPPSASPNPAPAL